MRPRVTARRTRTGLAGRHAKGSGGSVAGCITDVAGQPLPGVTVDAVSGDVRHTVVSNKAGCYSVTELAGRILSVRRDFSGSSASHSTNCASTPDSRRRSTSACAWPLCAKCVQTFPLDLPNLGSRGRCGQCAHRRPTRAVCDRAGLRAVSPRLEGRRAASMVERRRRRGCIRDRGRPHSQRPAAQVRRHVDSSSSTESCHR